MTKKKLFLFPGAHKTATSLLQAAMESHRTALEAQGMVIARRQTFYRSGMRDFLLRKEAPETIDMQVWNAMAEDVFGPSWQDRDVVISIENLFGEATPNVYAGAGRCIDTLKHIFPDYDFQVVFYVRRQDSFLESVFLQNVHRGFDEDVDSFLVPFAKAKPIDWLKILKPVVERVGENSVKIVPFETIKAGPKAYILDFFRHFTDLPKKQLLSTYGDLGDTNVSLSELGLRVARAGFVELPKMKERRVLATALQREFGVDKYPRFKIPAPLRERIVEQHRDVNKRLVASGVIPDELKSYYLFEEEAVPKPSK